MITFKNKGNEIDMYIYGEITAFPYDTNDKSAEDVRQELDMANGQKLNIYINSGGGDVFEGQAISALIERYKGYKACYIDGICASIATKIPFACDEVNFAEGAYFMIHRASGLAWGTYDDMLKMADTLEQIDNGLVTTYKNNSKMTEDDIRTKMRNETWYTSETINNDFSFNIVSGKKMAACVTEETLNRFTNKPKDIEIVEKPDKVVNTLTNDEEVLEDNTLEFELKLL